MRHEAKDINSFPPQIARLEQGAQNMGARFHVIHHGSIGGFGPGQDVPEGFHDIRGNGIDVEGHLHVPPTELTPARGEAINLDGQTIRLTSIGNENMFNNPDAQDMWGVWFQGEKLRNDRHPATGGTVVKLVRRADLPPGDGIV